MNLLNIYFYPKINYRLIESPNPYIYDLENSLSQRHNIVNKKYNKIGVLDFFRYFFKTDVFLFNWIEDIPTLRYGKMQVLMFILFTYLAQLKGIKLWWILHNKYSHDIKKNRWTDFMFNFLMSKTDKIITHSSGGIDFIKEINPSFIPKINYIIHPVNKIISKSSPKEKDIDFLIWGTIFPYKGIVPFLQYVSQSQKFSNLKIMIIGRCYDTEYKNKIKKYLSRNINYNDDFFEFREITEFSNRAKFILFTHNSRSVLSSGALMDSIRMRSVIIGPNHGSFKDLNSYNFVHTYNSYDDIISIYNNHKFDKITNEELEDFCSRNSWELFIDKLDEF